MIDHQLVEHQPHEDYDSSQSVTTQPHQASGSRLKLASLLALTLGIGIAGGWVLGRGNVSDLQLGISPEMATRLVMTDEPVMPLSVQIAQVEKQSIQLQQTLTGSLEAIESVTLTSRVQGRVSEITVQEGQAVSQGQVIARIDVSDILATQQQAQAQLQQTHATLRLAQARDQHAQAFLNQTQAQLVEAEAERDDAQLHQQRMQDLYNTGAVSQSVLDEANTRLDVINARITQIQAAIQQAEIGIVQAAAEIQQAEAGIAQAQATVAETEAHLNYGVVVAPFNGVVTEKLAEIGTMAGSGEKLFVLESSDQLRFSVAVPESAITQVRTGQTVRIRLDALNRDVDGQISQIIPNADPIARNVTVKVALPSLSDAIPGMFGRLYLTTHQRTALVIPATALVEQMGITGVYRVVDQQAQFQPVVIGGQDGDYVEVFSGLEADQSVVLQPSSHLSHGHQIQIS